MMKFQKYHFIKKERQIMMLLHSKNKTSQKLKVAIAFGFWLPIRSERSKSMNLIVLSTFHPFAISSSYIILIVSDLNLLLSLSLYHAFDDVDDEIAKMEMKSLQIHEKFQPFVARQNESIFREFKFLERNTTTINCSRWNLNL